MAKRIFVNILFFIGLLFSVSFAQGLATEQEITWQAVAKRVPFSISNDEIENLERTWLISEISPNIIRMTDRLTGVSRLMNLDLPHILSKDLLSNVQIIDYVEIDTFQIGQTFKYKTTYPIGGLGLQHSLINDFNNNGLLDIAGTYKVDLSPELVKGAIGEVNENGQFVIHKVFDQIELALGITDTDRDGVDEINMRGTQVLYNFKSANADSLPTIYNFEHRIWEVSGVITFEKFGYVDKDSLLDIIYVGDDSLNPGCFFTISLAEYDPTTNRYIEKFDTCPPGIIAGNTSISDLDGDERNEFIYGSLHGDVYYTENIGNNKYSVVQHDTLNATNLHINAITNDINNNGKPELFIGGTAFVNGESVHLVSMIEGVSNNNYEVKHQFIIKGIDFFRGVRLQVYDYNLDGVEELLFVSGRNISLLQWNNETSELEVKYFYELNYTIGVIHGAVFAQTSSDPMPFLAINTQITDSEPLLRTDIYELQKPQALATDITNTKVVTVKQNSPNPFNNQTKIQFSLRDNSNVNLEIFNAIGQKITTIVKNKMYKAGIHYLNWNGTNQSREEVGSGVYFYILTISDVKGNKNSISEARKMIYLK